MMSMNDNSSLSQLPCSAEKCSSLSMKDMAMLINLLELLAQGLETSRKG
jgi:hypothetical protein